MNEATKALIIGLMLGFTLGMIIVRLVQVSS